METAEGAEPTALTEEQREIRRTLRELLDLSLIHI